MQVGMFLNCSGKKMKQTIASNLLWKQNIEWCQINYTVREHDLLMEVYPFEKFRTYLLGKNFVVDTDHTVLWY